MAPRSVVQIIGQLAGWTLYAITIAGAGLAGTAILGLDEPSGAAVASTPRPTPHPGLVGSAACGECHQAEWQAWAASHHALAMQAAMPESVLGDFSGAAATAGESSAVFALDGGRFTVETEGADAVRQSFAVTHTFGVSPLQQYLIEQPGGRLQSLGFAWDTRPAEVGGQRWFHLFPDDPPAPGSDLHWTGRDQTWNYMCADCHSTDLAPGYDLAGDRYDTTWAEMSVGCEACHGPGAAHLAWARGERPDIEDMGLALSFADPPGSGWIMEPTRGIARWEGMERPRPELDVCGRCHSRRAVIDRHAPIGAPLLDSHLPALLDGGLYFPDGQIDGEVFEWGSFLQSRMYQAGVTCSDCHEPHSAALRVQGNGLCAQCHEPARFDTVEHHRHAPGGEAAQCVSCHMPERLYMVVDGRRDHGIRVPRPDLSVAIGTPNACTGCHADHDPQWAADAIASWTGRAPPHHWGTAIDAGRRGLPGADTQLVDLARDGTAPAIARATALRMLGRRAGPSAVSALGAAVGNPDSLVRLGVALGAAGLDLQDRPSVAAPLLADPARAVRIEAARALAPSPGASALSGFDTALDELRASQLAIAERPEAHLNLGLLSLNLGDIEGAEAEYRTALRLDPSFIPAYVNLSDLERLRGRDAEGERLLDEALAIAPDNPDALYALALTRVRLKRLDDALTPLRQAVEFAPENARYAYVLGEALDAAGDMQGAIAALEAAAERHPYDGAILGSLAMKLVAVGDRAGALDYAERLLAIEPLDADLRTFVEQLRR